ncbi:MAG: zinc ribbon domain-containing protein [Candidatus Lokiarchaeota archaeon]|nr:zinc ribbon domain-containing protein [Candidatus Lokiarchaeota archaeon]
MGHKYGYYSLKMPLEEVLSRTHSFWATNSGTINSQTTTPNKLIYTLNIKRDISMMSYGETYTMKIGYNPDNETTYVSVEVSLSFGYGMQWLKPQGKMKQWALDLGTTPMKLERTIAPNFVKMFEDIQNMAPYTRVQEATMFCPSCGKINSRENTYCQECGTKLPV